jgi:hypothetical protein
MLAHKKERTSKQTKTNEQTRSQTLPRSVKLANTRHKQVKQNLNKTQTAHHSTARHSTVMTICYKQQSIPQSHETEGIIEPQITSHKRDKQAATKKKQGDNEQFSTTATKQRKEKIAD